jgi:hypothetical protein
MNKIVKFGFTDSNPANAASVDNAIYATEAEAIAAAKADGVDFEHDNIGIYGVDAQGNIYINWTADLIGVVE